MVIEKMTERECNEFLARAVIGRLGCSLDDQAYVVPMGFVYEPGRLYALSTLGQKIEWMRRNPRVCVQFDEIANRFQWLSVVVDGRYRELPEPQFAAERAHARKRFEQRERWWQTALAERQIESGDHLIEPFYFCIDIESITGLRAVDGSPSPTG